LSRQTNIKHEKRQFDTEETAEKEEVFLEIIEPNDFCDYIAQFFPTQLENDTENIPCFHFQCMIDISSFDKLTKEVANELVEFIEDVDGLHGCMFFYNFYNLS